MSIRQKNDSLIDFSDDINLQLCAIVKLTDFESIYVANANRIITNCCHRMFVVNY